VIETYACKWKLNISKGNLETLTENNTKNFIHFVNFLIQEFIYTLRKNWRKNCIKVADKLIVVIFDFLPCHLNSLYSGIIRKLNLKALYTI
jgi:hypothetical protein